MGCGRFDYDTYSTRAKTYSGKSVEEYTSDSLNPNLDPCKIKIRESRDSDANPESNAVILGIDLTGSMGFIADHFAKEGLGTLCQGIYDKKPISDPHIMVMGIGDIECDQAPLQVSQFEAETKPLMDQIEMLWVHHGGGGNSHESYTLPWFFADLRTAIDCYEKRQRKGYLFTVGDEPINPTVQKSYISRVLGKVPKDDFRTHTAEELLQRVQQKYHVFHIIVDEGSCGKDKSTHDSWIKVLGQHVIHMPDHKSLSQTVITAIMVKEGMDFDEAMKTWDRDTADKIKSGINFRT